MIQNENRFINPARSHVSKMILMSFCLLMSLCFYGQQNNSNGCKINLPSIEFRSNNAVILSPAKIILDYVAQKLKENPGCSIIMIAYADASKRG